jgi:hypothetical protein
MVEARQQAISLFFDIDQLFFNRDATRSTGERFRRGRLWELDLPGNRSACIFQTLLG